MHKHPLAIHGGEKTRRTPMPPRRAFGEAERAMLMEAVDYYASRDEDPPYQGRYERLLCEAFSAYMGGGHTDAVATGTAAVFVALAALELPRGSEVIISPVTDSGPLNCILMQGLVPVVADSAPGSYNMGVEQFLARVTPRTSAVLAVHSAGEPLEIDRLVEAAHARGVKVLEDCSQCPGGSWKGLKVGTAGDIAAFSTMYRKTLTAGASGGLVWSPDEDTYRRALAHADRGKPAWRTDVDLRNPGHALFPALNFNTDELSCAIGLASLARLDDSVARRVAFVRRLSALLEDSEVCAPYPFHEGFSPFYFPIMVDAEKIACTKTEFALAVQAEGIGLGEHYGCLVAEWSFAKPLLSDDFTTVNAFAVRDSSFNLYLNERYGEEEAQDVLRAVRKVEQWYLK
ncbi:GDP-perosamine synthase [Fundidesulfovibrio magnetotacticus]|uniref:GDP-perosamine synthase n=1 Tax=Fundidesulfovibrio magnetotacticus TaxID=2730080 RepID=A0A6V8LT80_9BACT|nr:DegT/DnrJ/EryC1/StrS family aminotransferase [Fundidesulfovibrio magnetotacticus]GFK94934.1 GDP-perosamine synthase [Fundidesulfovibrio magnetotacticus]